MRLPHGLNQIILFSACTGSRYSDGARTSCVQSGKTTMSPERVISISISEADWKMLRSIQPEPVDWLKGKIRETVEQARQAEQREPDASQPVKMMSAGR
jgi:hypothetical protein